jgi:hypothetical protein
MKAGASSAKARDLLFATSETGQVIGSVVVETVDQK